MKLSKRETGAILTLAIAVAILARPVSLRAEWIYNTDQDKQSTQQQSDESSSSIVVNPPPVIDSSAPAQPIPDIPLILAPPFGPGTSHGMGMPTSPSQGIAPPVR
jgi:hypothetical protein